MPVLSTAAAVAGAAGEYASRQSDRRQDIAEQNADGYEYGETVSQTDRPRSRTTAPPRRDSRRIAWYLGGLALVAWLAVRK